MSRSDRFHRDEPGRTHPRRNMSGMLRNDDPWSTRPAPEEPRAFSERGGGRFDETQSRAVSMTPIG